MKTIRQIICCLLMVAFLSVTTGCETTVTKYDSEGKPYSAKEFNAWQTIGVLILLGALAASAAGSGGKDGSFLHKDGALLASANNDNIISDAISIPYANMKWFQLFDSHGNLLSKHLIDLDQINTITEIKDLSEVQISSDINYRELYKFIQKSADDNDIKSMPTAIVADVSVLSDNSGIKINSVNISHNINPNELTSDMILSSVDGLYRIMTDSDRSLGNRNQFKVFINQLTATSN